MLLEVAGRKTKPDQLHPRRGRSEARSSQATEYEAVRTRRTITADHHQHHAVVAATTAATSTIGSPHEGTPLLHRAPYQSTRRTHNDTALLEKGSVAVMTTATVIDERLPYGALRPGEFSMAEGVMGEWTFDGQVEQQGRLQHADDDHAVQDNAAVAEAMGENKGFLAVFRSLFSVHGLGLLVLCSVTTTMGVLAIIYREELFQGFDDASGYIRSKGALGSLALIFATFITSYFPMIGWAWSLFACGYIYGWMGFIPAYIGSLLGGLSSFIVYRHFFQDWIRKKTRAYPKYVALERAIENEGLLLVILIRIAPYPYPLFNTLFAATRIPFVTFALGTAIALVKVFIHISIGMSLSHFSELIHGDASSKWDLAFLVLGVTLGIGVGIYLYCRTKRYLQKYNTEEEEEEETMSEVLSSEPLPLAVDTRENESIVEISDPQEEHEDIHEEETTPERRPSSSEGI